MIENLLYIIKKENISKEYLVNILKKHKEIKFISLVGIDIYGNDTDEKIPTEVFISDIDTFLNGCAVQTDGSSVVFTGIATLNDAKIDMIIDKNCNWFVDYNIEHIDEETNKPIGTLRIPSFLIHNGKFIDPRSILNRSLDYLKSNILRLLKENENMFIKDFSFEDIEDIIVNTATELEFWVSTPEEKININNLSTSEHLQEQYWNMTKGIVRTALEKSLIIMSYYDLKPEMGHKEVGGIKSKLDSKGRYHILEQLEVDWKYSTALQACDNVLIAKSIIKETFKRHGLNVTFCAKPIEKVAGNGEHLHISIFLKLKNGNKINLFYDKENEFLSSIGYGALMGILKNYEIINPFISNTTDSLKRLKPGFEAPVCTVTSLGISKEIPSRNRSILIGLIRDLENPFATRFELRSPNPKTNIYLTLAAVIMACIDGIDYSINKTERELLNELSKDYNCETPYLEKNRIYRSEENVFEKYTNEQRDMYFGKSPKTVFENMENLYNKKHSILLKGNVFTKEILNSFKISSLSRYLTELNNRILPSYIDKVNSIKEHSNSKSSSLISLMIKEIKFKLTEDTLDYLCMFSDIKDNIKEENFKRVSELHIKIEETIELLENIHVLI